MESEMMEPASETLMLAKAVLVPSICTSTFGAVTAALMSSRSVGVVKPLC